MMKNAKYPMITLLWMCMSASRKLVFALIRDAGLEHPQQLSDQEVLKLSQVYRYPSPRTQTALPISQLLLIAPLALRWF